MGEGRQCALAGCKKVLERAPWETFRQFSKRRYCHGPTAEAVGECRREAQRQWNRNYRKTSGRKKQVVQRIADYREVYAPVVKYEGKTRPVLVTEEEQRRIDRAAKESDVRRMNLVLAPCRSLSREEIDTLVARGEVTPVGQIRYTDVPLPNFYW